LALLSTSIYPWATIAQLRRERAIGIGLTVLYTVMSLIFVTDIVAGVLLFGHSRRRPRVALIAILLSVGLLALAFGLVGIFIDDPTFKYGPEPITLGGYIVAGVGIAVILPTVIVSFVRRSTLRAEAQQAALASGTSTETNQTMPAA
jgi:hypothetical protein